MPVEINGTDEWIDCGTDASLNADLAGEMTMAIWVKFNSDYSSLQILVSNFDSPPTVATYDLEFGRTNNKFDWVQGGNARGPSTGSISDDNWHHIVVVRSGSSGNWDIDFYIDGSFDSTGNMPQDPASHTETCAIGRAGSDGGAFYLNGTVDEVTIWDVALSPAEAISLHNPRTRGTSRQKQPSNRKGHWSTANDGPDGTSANGTDNIIDETVNKNHGSGVNGIFRAGEVLSYLGDPIYVVTPVIAVGVLNPVFGNHGIYSTMFGGQVIQ